MCVARNEYLWRQPKIAFSKGKRGHKTGYSGFCTKPIGLTIFSLLPLFLLHKTKLSLVLRALFCIFGWKNRKFALLLHLGR
jgi:hypothetical protein